MEYFIEILDYLEKKKKKCGYILTRQIYNVYVKKT